MTLSSQTEGGWRGRREMRAAAGLATTLLLTAAASALAVAPPPVVVAIDTSRSLAGADLATATQLLGAAVRGLPAGTPVALLSFDDEPRWLVSLPGSAEEVAARLAELSPSGRFTLLHDALFLAARALPEGGVLLVASDGRDENSATTLEDVSQRCDAAGVRILAVGLGRHDERILRRLALLTQGAYLGPLTGATASDIREELQRATSAVASARPEPRAKVSAPGAPVSTAEPQAPVAPLPGTQPPAPPPSATTLLPSWVAAVGALLAAGLASWALLRWRPTATGTSTRDCPTCGRELPPGQVVCPHCREKELAAILRAKEVLPAEIAQEVSLDDTASFVAALSHQPLEVTLVLGEEYALVVHEPGESARSFLLPIDRSFGVGRDSKRNTLGFADPTLSSQHFRIVPEDGTFWLLDLDSTNGTLVNGERVRLQRLASGDEIRAGQEEFEFRMHLKRAG